MKRQREQALNRTIAAARRVVIPTADNCTECGEQIPSDRQIAMPGCQLCRDCAEELEHKRGMFV